MQSGSSAPIKIDDPRCQHFELQGRAMLILKNVNKSMDGDYECHLNFQDGNVLRNFTALRVVSKFLEDHLIRLKHHMLNYLKHALC